jgi:hypothetical protein
MIACPRCSPDDPYLSARRAADPLAHDLVPELWSGGGAEQPVAVGGSAGRRPDHVGAGLVYVETALVLRALIVRQEDDVRARRRRDALRAPG